MKEIRCWVNKNIGKRTDERLSLFYFGLMDKLEQFGEGERNGM